MKWISVALMSLWGLYFFSHQTPLRGDQRVQGEVSTSVETSCFGKAEKNIFEVESEIVLAKKAFPSTLTQDLIEQAIKKQIQFLPGHFRSESYDGPVSLFSLGFKDPHITQIKVVDSAYGMSKVIDDLGFKGFEPKNPYILNIQKTGAVAESDLAWKIQFRAQFEAATCLDQAIVDWPQVQLPKDPFLAYWDIHPDNRKNIRFRSIERKINPCADSELADLPHPETYWYFWDPSKEIENEIRCSESLANMNTAASLVKVASKEQEVDFKKDGMESATIILGWVDTQKVSVEDIAKMAKQLRSQSAQVSGKFVDPTAYQLLNIVSYLQTSVKKSRLKIEARKDHLWVTLSGQYEGRGLRWNIYWGPTDEFGSVSPQHHSYLNKALSQEKLVVYAGHAGLGENIKNQKITESSVQDQIVAILSCYSYAYFHPLKFFNNLKEGMRRQILYTGSNMGLMDAPIIALVDRMMFGKENQGSFAEQVGTDNLYIKYNFEGGSQ